MMNDLAGTRQNVWRGNTGPALAEASGVVRHLRAMFKWAVDEDLITADPTQGVRDPRGKNGKSKSERERVLSEDEIKALWRICDDDLKFPFGPLVQLLLLTGQREREIGNMTWPELDLDRRVLSLPSTRTKNGRAHSVHLSDLTLEEIGKLPRFGDAKGYVFSLNGTKPVESYSDAKVRIDKRLAELLPDTEPWTFHDLRRTMTTMMADSETGLGIAPHVVDKILNHVSGSISGVARVYNRNEYAPERRAALDAWGRYLESLVYPDRAQDNVVALHGR
jgi:integrase